jgi:hypothetical protein
VDWDDVATPARILAIINLHNLKPNYKIQFPRQTRFIAEPGLYVVVQSYDVINTVAEKAAKLAAKEVSMHVSPKKRRSKKRPRTQVAARVTQAAEEDEVIEGKDPPIFKTYKLSLLPGSAHLPILYVDPCGFHRGTDGCPSATYHANTESMTHQSWHILPVLTSSCPVGATNGQTIGHLSSTGSTRRRCLMTYTSWKRKTDGRQQNQKDTIDIFHIY